MLLCRQNVDKPASNTLRKPKEVITDINVLTFGGSDSFLFRKRRPFFVFRPGAPNIAFRDTKFQKLCRIAEYNKYPSCSEHDKTRFASLITVYRDSRMFSKPLRKQNATKSSPNPQTKN